MKLLLTVKKSDKNGKLYRVLEVDLGYRKAVITFDEGIISEMLGCSIGYLYTLPIGEKIVGVINMNK